MLIEPKKLFLSNIDVRGRTNVDIKRIYMNMNENRKQDIRRNKIQYILPIYFVQDCSCFGTKLDCTLGVYVKDWFDISLYMQSFDKKLILMFCR